MAHHYWSTLGLKGELVIDATCGNGHDALILAQLALTEDEGKLLLIDLQEEALAQSKRRLQEELSPKVLERIEIQHGCHSTFPSTIEKGTVKLVVYNLGYLPGGDKSKTTTTTASLASIENALPLITSGGALSITCYPGHPEGAAEEAAILELMTTLLPTEWSCCHHRWSNRKNSPSLILLQKACSQEPLRSK